MKAILIIFRDNAYAPRILKTKDGEVIQKLDQCHRAYGAEIESTDILEPAELEGFDMVRCIVSDV